MSASHHRSAEQKAKEKEEKSEAKEMPAGISIDMIILSMRWSSSSRSSKSRCVSGRCLRVSFNALLPTC